jgi:regulator of replication initiation timing
MLGLIKQFKLKKQIKKLTSENQALILENKKLEELTNLSNISSSPEHSTEEK